MTIVHHPTDASLAAYASGTLDECRGLVVATHVSLCAHCRNAVRAFEAVGGFLLEGAEPTGMSSGALGAGHGAALTVRRRSTPLRH